RNLEEVIKLIKKHEAFEKSSAAQEERFQALEKLTTFELKEMQRKQEEEEKRRRILKGPSPKASPEKAETTFPAEGARLETSLGSEIEDSSNVQQTTDRHGTIVSPSRQSTLVTRKQEQTDTARHPKVLQVSESPSWRLSLTRHRHFDPLDSPGKESGEGFEGHLIRKHTYETFNRKASTRSWDKLYTVLRGNQLSFYKDQRHREENELFRGEKPINLQGCSVVVAAEYTKRRFVLSLRTPTGAEYLFQARDDDDLQRWLERLSSATGTQEPEISQAAAAPRSATMPAPSAETAAAPKKKAGFFTLKKK
uniref:PH domain-containing protein n=1 Tax=Romanomermis culicivorax TaxID=13658 RepID=A0A915IT01_ROMCU